MDLVHATHERIVGLVELLKAAYVEGFQAAHKVFVSNNFLSQAGDKCPS